MGNINQCSTVIVQINASYFCVGIVKPAITDAVIILTLDFVDKFCLTIKG
jgi:hypothetical protein